MTLSTGTALYYPYVHARKPDHFKSALTYWDRVRRIVPPSLRQGDYAFGDDDEARLMVDRGLLVSTEPEPYEEHASITFLEHVEPQSSKFRIDLATAHDLASRNRGIHTEKLGEELVYRLVQLGLAHRVGDWVSMRDEVGALYMFCLASEMGRRMNAALFSDSSDDSAIGQALLFEPEAPASVSEILLRVGLKLPSPEDLHAIPMHRIADFAQRRAAERLRFRAAIEGIVETARSTPDPNALEDFLHSKQTEITEAVGNLRRTLDELHVGTISGFSKISVPAAAGAALVALPVSGIAAAMLAAAGLAISAISCYAETRGKLRQARTSSPYHYLVSMERDLGVDATAGL